MDQGVDKFKYDTIGSAGAAGGRGGARIEKGEEERYDGDAHGRSVCAGLVKYLSFSEFIIWI